MKKLILASSIFLFTQISAFASDCKDLVYNGVFPKTTAPVQILCKNGFVLGYSLDQKTLLWAAERIDPGMNYYIKKRPAFHRDPTIPADAQSSNSDFPGTGYDKGHMVSFDDMAYSPQSALDSMSLTNIVPQNFSNNRGGWKSLEDYARKAAQHGPLFVVSGPIFEGKIDHLGQSQIPIPTKLYKVIINPAGKTARTYILPNTSISAYEVGNYEATRQDVAREGIDPTPGAQLTDIK